MANPNEESSSMLHHSGISVNWTYEEQAILETGLARYSSEPSLSRYIKIALELQNKTVRDVAMRCRWIYEKESAKRRKEDHNGSGRPRTDNKDDMVASLNSVPQVFASSPPLREEEEHGLVTGLLKKNEQILNKICANFKSFQIIENLALLSQSREVIRNIVNNLNENVPEQMKQMPPLPEILSDELLDLILPPPSNLPALP